MYEVELKFPVPDVGPIVAQITAWGAIPGPEQPQVDLYFNHPARDFAQTNEAFRLRQIGEENRLTYKGPVLDTQAKTRREIEFPIAAGAIAAAQCREMLVLLGFRPVREVRKRRVPFQYSEAGREFEIAVDLVEQLGSFIEIETIAGEADRAVARDAILDVAARLELPMSEPRSYLSLLLKCYPTSSD